MKKYLILMILALSYFLWVSVFNLWLPEKDKRLAAEGVIKALNDRIEKYNQTEQKYMQKIKAYKAEVKHNADYQNWAKTSVPSDMLKLLQK
ncbi:MAG: hypothetical protein PHE89_06655 [Alphaproteobacteria bacterium]|nr:hypothetical protein [Alphaproteobacteria bacterium]